MTLLLYWYCIYAFLANCRKGACGYVQCWKSSVLSSFLNTEKVILGSFRLEGRQFQAAGQHERIHEANCLGGGGWHKQVTGRRRSQV